MDIIESIRNVLHLIENYHDTYSVMHEENVGIMMEHLATSLGYDEKYSYELRQAGCLHDIGKISLPSNILEKTSVLTLFEKGVIKMHPVIGGEIINKIKLPPSKLKILFNVSVYHHESYDGNGYPYNLKADQIPIEARICSVCDVYEALRGIRPYRNNSFSHKKVVNMIFSKKTNGLFYKFDPVVLDAFSAIQDKFEEIIFSSKNH